MQTGNHFQSLPYSQPFFISFELVNVPSEEKAACSWIDTWGNDI